MRQLVYAGIGSRATPRAVLEQMTVMAAWLARRGWHLHTGGAAGADTAFAAGAPFRSSHPVPALARLPRKRGAGLPHALAGPDGTLSFDRLGPASGLAPLLARRTETSCAQRCDPRGRYRRARRCGGGLHRRRGGQGRNGHGHPDRPRPRHSGAEPWRAPPTCGLRASGGNPHRSHRRKHRAGGAGEGCLTAGASPRRGRPS